MNAQWLINTYQNAILSIGKRGRLIDARHVVSSAERNNGMAATVYDDRSTKTKSGFVSYCESRIAALSLGNPEE